MTDLEILRADLVAARLPHVRARRIALLAAAAAVTLTAAAYAANHYLGQPAPERVRATFARLGAWMPGNGTIDVSKAEVVAISRHTVVYGAPTASGRFCFELLGRRGFVYQLNCSGQGLKRLELYAGLANHGTATMLPPVAITGRMSERGRTLEVRTPDGRVQRVSIGLHGFFSFEPAAQEAARRGRAVLYERDASGSVTTRVRIPAQIVLNTRGTPARQVEGVLFDPRARHVFFEVWARQPKMSNCVKSCRDVSVAQTGIGRAVEVARDGTFSFTVPPQLAFKLVFLSMQITDARFIPLDPGVVDGTNVPDERFWKHARAEAARG